MLMKNENSIIRIIKAQNDKVFVIDCIKKTMPKWCNKSSLSGFTNCSDDELYERTYYIADRILTQEESRIAQDRFTMIAGVLSVVGDAQKRNKMIEILSEHQSKQTIRKYLCLYLVYQDIKALAPPYRPELKSCMERSFGLIQGFYKSILRVRTLSNPTTGK